MVYEGALETCTRCTRLHSLTRLSTPPEQGIAHLRQVDGSAPVVYELDWDAATRADVRLVRAHWAANPGAFPFSPPREGRTITATWADGRMPSAVRSGSHRTMRVQIHELIASD